MTTHLATEIKTLLGIKTKPYLPRRDVDEGTDQGGQQEKEGGGGAESSGEEMEEEEQPREGKGGSDEEEHLLNTAPGEEKGDNVEDNITYELLEETKEVEEKQEEVTEIGVEVEAMEEVMTVKEEQRGRIEETSFLKVKDLSDPIELNPS